MFCQQTNWYDAVAWLKQSFLNGFPHRLCNLTIKGNRAGSVKVKFDS
jgi:predicted Rdx family selenoprotein